MWILERSQRSKKDTAAGNIATDLGAVPSNLAGHFKLNFYQRA